MKRVLWGLLLLWASGCTCARTPGLEQQPYACKSQDECASGYVCVRGECTSVSNDGGCMPTGSGVEACDDKIDNDCNLLTDCEDPACGGQRCGAGKLCIGTACTCSPDAGSSAPPTETQCGDGQDDDCDTFPDCADRDCINQPCNAFGSFCVAQQCTCVVDGGTAEQGQETLCTDGVDNDCDGLADCADPDCSVCGPNGLRCINSSCQCGGNGGTPQATEQACDDGFDNDCDGLADCADPDCGGRGCATTSGGTPAAGYVCSASQQTCVCGGNGGTAESAETICNDRADNDCNGQTDCADSSCNNRICDVNGKTCQGTACLCGGNGGPIESPETSCTDGHDNDCNGATDCADTACSGVTCGANGLQCSSGACRCSGNGATPETTETTCSDGRDNDCDGKVDCADTNCGGRSCGTGCLCVGLSKTETNCSDGSDNDGDGNTDCADSDCNVKSCGTGCICSSLRAVETTCSDGSDNDGDGNIDCADSDCVGRSCGSGCICGQSAKVETNCSDGSDNDGDGNTDGADPDCCEVLGLGGCEICSNGADDNGNLAVDCADTAACNGHSCGTGCTCNSTSKEETSCADSVDNDGNGQTDCVDPSCTGRSCGANGKTCSNSACICPTTGLPAAPTETNCGDGLDNDCDGLTDCNDPDCNRKFCGDAFRPAAYCCGTGTNANVCKDLDRDASNCGTCGTSCSRGCIGVIVSGGVRSGVCACTGSGNGCANVPNAGCTSTSGMGGSGNGCTCTNNTSCSVSTPAGTCTATQGLGSPGYCHY